MPRVIVQIVTWNAAHAIGDALAALKEQTFKDFGVVVVDNASGDGSLDLVRGHFPDARILRNFKNLGGCRARNQALELARSVWMADDRQGRSSVDRYALVLQPDVTLAPDALAQLVAAMDGRFQIGSATGTVLKMRPRSEEHGDPERTDVIDSTGIRVCRSRRFRLRGAGERLKEGDELPTEIFGAPATLALYRAEALQAASIEGQVFDEALFSYGEDVDVAWRLRLLGWGALHVPAARAYRLDAAREMSAMRFRQAFLGGDTRSPLAQRLLVRNRMMIAWKNDDVLNALRHAPMIFAIAVCRFFYVLFRAPRALTAYAAAYARLPGILAKRRATMRRRKASAKEIRKWLG